MPKNLTFEEAAAIPGVFITAWEGLLQYGGAKAGDWVLLCGASSGVGMAAMQIAKYKNIRVIAVSGSPHKLAGLKKLGADVVVQARGSDFIDDVMRATEGLGVAVSLNMVGATAFPGCIRVAANAGRVVLIGYVDGQLKAEIDLETVHGKRLMVTGISNTTLTPAERSANMKAFMGDVGPALASGMIKPVIDRIFPFNQMLEAKAYVETDQMIGKVIVRM
jgi:NADPH:quinone reductase-like Zn-dependent oxidoreductase